MGASLSLPTEVVSFCQSSSFSAPVRILCWSSRPSEPSMRMTSWGPLISMLNIAAGIPTDNATCSAMFSASAVLPILGRPATITRSPGCRPEVMRSRSVKPVAMPVTSLGLSRLYSVSMRSTTLVSSGWISLKPWRPREPASAIANTSFSALSSRSLAERPRGLYTESVIPVPTSASLRMMARSRTISA